MAYTPGKQYEKSKIIDNRKRKGSGDRGSSKSEVEVSQSLAGTYKTETIDGEKYTSYVPEGVQIKAEGYVVKGSKPSPELARQLVNLPTVTNRVGMIEGRRDTEPVPVSPGVYQKATGEELSKPDVENRSFTRYFVETQATTPQTRKTFIPEQPPQEVNNGKNQPQLAENLFTNNWGNASNGNIPKTNSSNYDSFSNYGNNQPSKKTLFEKQIDLVERWEKAAAQRQQNLNNFLNDILLKSSPYRAKKTQEAGYGTNIPDPSFGEKVAIGIISLPVTGTVGFAESIGILGFKAGLVAQGMLSRDPKIREATKAETDRTRKLTPALPVLLKDTFNPKTPEGIVNIVGVVTLPSVINKGVQSAQSLTFIGKTKIPAETIVEPKVLVGEKTFPSSSKSAPALLDEFKNSPFQNAIKERLQPKTNPELEAVRADVAQAKAKLAEGQRSRSSIIKIKEPEYLTLSQLREITPIYKAKINLKSTPEQPLARIKFRGDAAESPLARIKFRNDAAESPLAKLSFKLGKDAAEPALARFRLVKDAPENPLARIRIGQDAPERSLITLRLINDAAEKPLVRIRVGEKEYITMAELYDRTPIFKSTIRYELPFEPYLKDFAAYQKNKNLLGNLAAASAASRNIEGGFSASPAPLQTRGGVQAGTSATPGLYAAPTLSTYFLKLTGEGGKPSFSLFPKLSRPSANYIITEGIGLIPEPVVRRAERISGATIGLGGQREASGVRNAKGKYNQQGKAALQELNKYFENDLVGSGRAAISPEYFLGKSEKEALIGQGSSLKVIDSSLYTEISGRKVPLRIIKAGKATEEFSLEGLRTTIADVRARSIIKSSYKAPKTNIPLYGSITPSRSSTRLGGSSGSKPKFYDLTGNRIDEDVFRPSVRRSESIIPEPNEIFTPTRPREPSRPPERRNPIIPRTPYEPRTPDRQRTPYNPLVPSTSKPPTRPIPLWFKPQRNKGFTVEVRRLGRFREVGRGLSREKAIQLGKGIATGTAARTFRLKSGGVVVPINERLNGFYSKGLNYIEEAKFGIDSPGELGEITFAPRKRRKAFTI